MRNLHCALKHISIADMGMIELKQKVERFFTLTQNKEYIKILKELDKIHKEISKINLILMTIFFKKDTLSEEDKLKVIDSIRVLRNKLELVTIELFKIGIDIEDKEVFENGYLEDFQTVYSNLAHAEIHLNLELFGEEDGETTRTNESNQVS